MPSAVRRIIALFLGVLHLAGCGTWRTLPPGDPAEMFGRWENRPAAADTGRRDVYRITRRDGVQVELTNPAVRGDSTVDDGMAVAISEIQRVDDRRVSAGRTLALIVTPIAVVVGLVAAFAIGCSSTPQCGD